MCETVLIPWSNRSSCFSAGKTTPSNLLKIQPLLSAPRSEAAEWSLVAFGEVRGVSKLELFDCGGAFPSLSIFYKTPLLSCDTEVNFAQASKFFFSFLSFSVRSSRRVPFQYMCAALASHDTCFQYGIRLLVFSSQSLVLWAPSLAEPSRDSRFKFNGANKFSGGCKYERRKIDSWQHWKTLTEHEQSHKHTFFARFQSTLYSHISNVVTIILFPASDPTSRKKRSKVAGLNFGGAYSHSRTRTQALFLFASILSHPTTDSFDMASTLGSYELHRVGACFRWHRSLLQLRLLVSHSLSLSGAQQCPFHLKREKKLSQTTFHKVGGTASEKSSVVAFGGW